MQCKKINLLKILPHQMKPDNYRTVKSGAKISGLKTSVFK